MAEITVQFRNKLNGYDKAEVNQFVKDAEAKLQEKASDIEAALNAAKDGFFASFEEAHGEDIKSIEQSLMAKKQQLRSEIESGK